MTDLALDLAKRIVSGGNVIEQLQRWAEEAAAEAPSRKGAK